MSGRLCSSNTFWAEECSLMCNISRLQHTEGVFYLSFYDMVIVKLYCLNVSFCPSQSLPPAKRVLLDLERIIHQSSDSGERHTRTEGLSVTCKNIWNNEYLGLFVAGDDAEEDQSIFAPLESDIDEDSQVSFFLRMFFIDLIIEMRRIQ